MCEMNLTNRCRMPESAHASLLTDHRMSGLPIRSSCKHFNTICEQFFLFELMVIQART